MTQKRKSLTPKANKASAETERRKSLVESDWNALKGAAKLLDDETLSSTHQELIEKSVETFEALIAFKEEQDKAKKPAATPTSKTSKTIAAKKGKAAHSTTKKTTTVLPRLRSSTSPKPKAAEVPKRKAGRPKKSTTEAPKKVGRPKKITDSGSKKITDSGSKKKAEAKEDTEKVYVVEKILDRKGSRGHYSYKVKWRGYKTATWVDRADFIDLSLPNAFDKSRAASK